VRTVLLPDESNPAYFYSVLTASVVPRPIAWVSSRSADGTLNLAPYSFFTVASVAPPVVQFTSVTEKDSVRNIRETGQFVINLATAALFEQINATSAAYGAEVDEFEAVGLVGEPSERVDVPRAARSPLSLECSLREIIPVGNSFLVLGDVLCATADSDILAADGLPSFADLAPLTRLGRVEWGLPGEVRTIPRPTLAP
jgi:flavin reductase (DIM6/NTAB) family NADH-FMN oxidoreductase RutF